MKCEEYTIKERVEKIAEMLGVDLGEEFNIVGSSPLYYCPYKITERGLVDSKNRKRDSTLVDLLRGIYKIEKLPWKPKRGDGYYYVPLWYKHEIKLTEFDSENPFEIALLKCGWMFRTEQEAEANKERVLKEYAEVMEK